MNKLKIGYVSIIGKPNVGKSTLLNTIFNKKISIINKKPQTTRNQIESVYNDEDSQIIFVDTPGFHIPKNQLDHFLNREIRDSYKKTDVVCFLTDITRRLDNEDLELLEKLNKSRDEELKVILVISKAEMAKHQEVIDERINFLKKKFDFDDVVMISGKEKINVNKFLSKIKQFLKEDIVLYSRELNGSLEEDDFFIKEIIREKCLDNLRQEIPYGVAINIDEEKYEEEKNLYTIKATIVVEKESQKSIVIGKGGSMIKKIGVSARKELLNIYDSRIDLQLFVKIEPDWRNSRLKLKEFGY